MSQRDMRDPMPFVLEHFQGVRPSGSGWEALCPVHDDSTPSLTIGWGSRTTGVALCCQKGCDNAAILEAAGLTFRDLFPDDDAFGRVGAPRPPVRPPPAKGASSAKPKPKLGPLVATYPYVDEAGETLYEVVRYAEPEKTFRQRRPDGNGGWEWKVGDVRRVPYRLPQLREGGAAGRWIFVVEGEKDVATLVSHAFVATCNAGGAEGGKGGRSKWHPDLNEHFRGARVVIVPDNDEAGWRHAQNVAAQLQDVAAEVRVLELPLGPRLPKHGKDVTDWFAEGHTAQELKALVENAGSPVELPRPAYVTGELRNDYGNARRLVRLHGENLRYVAVWGRWLFWDGNRWRKDEDGAAKRLAKATALSIFDEAKAAAVKDGDPKPLSSWANSSLAGAKIREMLATAESEKEVIASTDQLDTDPWLLNVRNGTVDLRTGDLRTHRREDLITKLGPVDFDPSATCPLWESFLERIMDGNRELIDFLRRAAGYSLTGSTREQCLFMPYGTGANGKSKFLGTLAALLGDYTETAESSTFLNKSQDAIRNDLAKLVGARFVTAIEVDQGRRIAEALVKQVTGEDVITARFLRQEYFSFLPQFKLWLAANHKPEVRGGDHGMWRRIHLIPFTVTIPVPERDPDLGEKLKAELPGILNWALRGCLEWQKNGLQVPEAVRAATAEYEQQMDPLGGFFEECVELVKDDPSPVKALWGEGEGSGEIKSSDLYREYSSWCERSGEKPLTSRTFGDRVKQRGVQWKHRKAGNFFLGLRLVKGGEGHSEVIRDAESSIGGTGNTLHDPSPFTSTSEKKSDLYDLLPEDGHGN